MGYVRGIPVLLPFVFLKWKMGRFWGDLMVIFGLPYTILA